MNPAPDLVPDPSPDPCESCRRGFSHPFDRYDQLANGPSGPPLLWRCRLCGTLWLEELRYARRIGAAEAAELFGTP